MSILPIKYQCVSQVAGVFFLSIIFSFLPNQDVHADVEPVKTSYQKKLYNLSNHHQWHHLLFYKNKKAEVISKNFYLTDAQAQQKNLFNPYQELLKTIEQANNLETVCRFPARYFWLNKYLPELNINLEQCSKIPDANQIISLILVSSYLKNPASTFGHVLVKTTPKNTAQTQIGFSNINDITIPNQQLSSEALMNDSYNFGATIPQNENGFIYAFKGLFGLYQAGFAKTDFFQQDAVYSKNEQRDMWEYVLNLDDFNTKLLNYHLYELQSARFDYYFIKQNCGYRSGELLELVTDIPMTKRKGGWYAPDFIFDQITENHNITEQNLIASLYYLPSEQTQLREKFSKINKKLQNIINIFIKKEKISIIDGLTIDEQILVLDFLIAHRNYLLSQKESEHHQVIKKQLIAKRFTLPTNDTFAQIPINTKIPPSFSNKTSQTAIQITNDEIKLSLSAFTKDPLNTYTEIDKRFEAIKLSGSYQISDNTLKFQEFVFLDMQQIENILQPLAKEPWLSWQLKAGTTQDLISQKSHKVYGQAGIGLGVVKDNKFTGYGFFNTRLHDEPGKIDNSLELGLRFKNKQKSAQISYEVTKRTGYDFVHQGQILLRQQLSKNDDFRLTFNYQKNPNIEDKIKHQTSISWHHYW